MLSICEDFNPLAVLIYVATLLITSLAFFVAPIPPESEFFMISGSTTPPFLIFDKTSGSIARIIAADALIYRQMDDEGSRLFS
jgi:hypothetical protein